MLNTFQKNQILEQAKPFLIACRFVSDLLSFWNIPTSLYLPMVSVSVVSESGLKQVYLIDRSMSFVSSKNHILVDLPANDRLVSVSVSFEFGVVFANDKTLRFTELIALDETVDNCLVEDQIVFDFFSGCCFTDGLQKVDVENQKMLVKYYQDRFDRLALTIGVEKLLGGAL
jgi:hypothetical protein